MKDALLYVFDLVFHFFVSMFFDDVNGFLTVWSSEPPSTNCQNLWLLFVENCMYLHFQMVHVVSNRLPEVQGCLVKHLRTK